MSVRRHLSYSNVAATMALVLAMGGSAVAASHYLLNSLKQINPKVEKALKGKTGAAGPAGKEGPQGKEGTAGKEGKAGPQGPGASQLNVNVPASTSATFSKVGSAGPFTLEVKCQENAGTHAVALEMNYTSAVPTHVVQTSFTSINGAATTTSNEAFTLLAAPTPAHWESLEAEEKKTSIERFNGNYLNPKLITSEGYVVNGGPGGNCEAAISLIPAT